MRQFVALHIFIGDSAFHCLHLKIFGGKLFKMWIKKSPIKSEIGQKVLNRSSIQAPNEKMFNNEALIKNAQWSSIKINYQAEISFLVICKSYTITQVN